MIFHIKKLYISISWHFFIMIIWIILTGKINAFFICLIALIIHELGHIITIYLLNEKINIFYILPFGFCCRIKNQNKISSKNMIKILVSGPISSILTSIICIFWSRNFAMVNFIIGIFNLLPLGSLDGGRLYKLKIKKV